MASIKTLLHKANPTALDVTDSDTGESSILIESMIPSDLAAQLQSRAGQRPLGDHLVLLSKRFGHLPLDDHRMMHISGAVRAEIEKIVGKSIQSDADLIDLLRRSKSFSLMGGLKVTIPDDLMELIAARYYGEPEGLDLSAEVQKIIERAFDRYRDGML